MYNQNYEEYMRAVLGYPLETQDTYRETQDYYSTPVSGYRNYELEEMYPEVYKTIYPTVCNVCNRNSNYQVTEEVLENMVNEVYNTLETEKNLNFYSKIENRKQTQASAMKEDRQRNNALLDIIRILILRELLNRPSHPGNRPQMPPIRPPFPRPRPF